MSSPRNRWITLKVIVHSADPQLLVGLEDWLQLGLLDDEQIQDLSERFLNCPLPVPVPQREPQRELRPSRSPETIPVEGREPSPPQPQPLWSRMVQSFQEEFSVRWLLFLGLFLVVLSSAVLAATQWSRFPAVGQYGILWLYTLLFAGVGVWTGKQEGLPLTARTLRGIVLLLIPLNGWAMDTFGLWGSWGGSVMVGLSSLSLGAIAFFLNPTLAPRALLLFLGLSLAHFGWSVPNVPLGAIYGGATVTLFFLHSEKSSPSSQTPLGLLVFAFVVLLVRGVFQVELPGQSLGLAIALLGWIVVHWPLSDSSHPLKNELQVLGCLGLALGWWSCMTQPFPWQATVITGLVLVYCWERFQKHWHWGYLVALFVISGQGVITGLRLVSPEQWQRILANAIQITGYSDIGGLLVTGGAFLYCWAGFIFLYGCVPATPRHLRGLGEGLILGLGGVICWFASYEPLWQASAFSLYTLAMGQVALRRPARLFLIYSTHVLGLFSLIFWINWRFPTLNLQIWALIFLGLMILEWGAVSWGKWATRSPHLAIAYQSSWYLGFLFAGLSYVLGLAQLFSPDPPLLLGLSLCWLLTPASLTWVALHSPQHRARAAQLSHLTLVFAQVLTFGRVETRFSSLALGIALMGVNSYWVPSVSMASVTLGFVFLLAMTLLWGKFALLPLLFFSGAFAILSLWGLFQGLRRGTTPLAVAYRRASNLWAWVLTLLEGLSLFLVLGLKLLYPVFPLNPHEVLILAPLVIAGAIALGTSHRPQNLAVYSICGALELALMGGVVFYQGSGLDLAIANTLFALLLFALTQFLLRPGNPWGPLESLKLSPLLFAGIGWWLRWGYFTPITGALTLGFALICISVSRRQKEWKSFVYLGLAGVSLAWYEQLLYQLSQTAGGHWGDGCTLLAAVATAIALAYRGLAWLQQHQKMSTLFQLTPRELLWTGYLHWLLGSILLLGSFLGALDTQPQLRILGLGVGFILAFYAVWQAREKPPTGEGWIYGGLILFLLTLLYGRLSIPLIQSIFDPWRVLITCGGSVLIYALPWPRWGWRAKPWQYCAVILPLYRVGIDLTEGILPILDLLTVALGYGAIALWSRQVRWSYLTLLFTQWAIFQHLNTVSPIDPLWYATLWGLSLLYIAQFDPALQGTEAKDMRHFCRLVGSGFIGGVALIFHSEGLGLLPMGLGLGISLFGLGLKVRAFLYSGTMTFLLGTFYQLIILITRLFFLKWVIGLLVGISLIIMAANFERSRNQVSNTLQNWLTSLQNWE